MLMIKVIAFDLVGVLVKENNFVLNEIETKIERLFGPNKNDDEFITDVKENICNVSDEDIVKLTKHIIHSIYDVKVLLRDLQQFKKIHSNIKFVIATNHVSFIEEYILNVFSNFWDKIYISATINEIKPNSSFYLKILQDQNISADEILFLDDSIKNIEGAINCGIRTIHVTKDMNILKELETWL